jgi:glycosyltransferase involved in cell wall biosynthesis
MIASCICRVPKRFALITGLGIAFTDDNKQSFSKIVNSLIKLLYKISFKCSSKIIFQNKDDKNLFKSLKIILKNNNTAIINGSGVNLNDYIETPLPRKLNFLFIGRFLSSKGLREFVQAAKIIKLSNPQIEFSIAGWTEHSEDSISKEEIFEWVEEEIINDLGYLDDVRPAISNASVFVLPSYREGTPRSVLEAMAMGRPVITSDAPGCRETVINKFNGFLVPVRSSKDIVKAMNFYINNPDSIKVMGSHSLELVKEKYDVKIINNMMLSHMGINEK